MLQQCVDQFACKSMCSIVSTVSVSFECAEMWYYMKVHFCIFNIFICSFNILYRITTSLLSKRERKQIFTSQCTNSIFPSVCFPSVCLCAEPQALREFSCFQFQSLQTGFCFTFSVSSHPCSQLPRLSVWVNEFPPDGMGCDMRALIFNLRDPSWRFVPRLSALCSNTELPHQDDKDYSTTIHSLLLVLHHIPQKLFML